MVINSRVIALLLAVSIAIVTTAFLSLFKVAGTALVVTFIIGFSSTYLLSYVVFEFLFFREINKIYQLLNKLSKRDLSFIHSRKKSPFNPLKRINEEIFTYAEFKQKEIDDLKRLEAFRKEFIANVSHELKTPIFAAQGFVHTLLDGAIKDKAVRNKFLKKAARSLDGLDMLVQDLLTLSQIETGEIKMHFEEFDIHKLTEEVFEQFEGKAERKNIRLRFENGYFDYMMVYGDWLRINQVMNNLISNAIKYSHENSQVSVGFRAEEDEVDIQVKDEGEGIPKEHLPRIFERFYRVDKSRSREKGGTGLGLAIVKHILEGHNSKVMVQSAPGKGSIFSFKLKKGVVEEIPVNGDS